MVAGNFALSFSLKFLCMSVHISQNSGYYWRDLFPAAAVGYR